MDKGEIKRQIAYWEAVKKDTEREIKSRGDMVKQINATLKFLRSQLGDSVVASTPFPNRDDVPEETYRAVDFTNPDEVTPV